MARATERSGPALGALRLPAWRRRGRSPRWSGRSWRARIGDPPADVPRLVAGAAEPAGPARRRSRGWLHAGRHGGGPQRGGRCRRDGRARARLRSGEHPDWLRCRGLGVHVRFRRRRGSRSEPDDRGHGHSQQQDHECQGGFEYLIQQAQVSHSSLLSRPVAGSCPDLPGTGQTERWLWICLITGAAPHAPGRTAIKEPSGRGDDIIIGARVRGGDEGPRSRVPLAEHAVQEQSNHNVCFRRVLVALISPDCKPHPNAGSEQRAVRGKLRLQRVSFIWAAPWRAGGGMPDLPGSAGAALAEALGGTFHPVDVTDMRPANERWPPRPGPGRHAHRREQPAICGPQPAPRGPRARRAWPPPHHARKGLRSL